MIKMHLSKKLVGQHKLNTSSICDSSCDSAYYYLYLFIITYDDRILKIKNWNQFRTIYANIKQISSIFPDFVTYWPYFLALR